MKVLRLTAALLALPAALIATRASAQPETSFRAGCAGLRAALAKVGPGEGGIVVIEVAGRLTEVRFDGAVAYLSVCTSPDPLVLCIAYGTNGREVGDEAVLRGSYEALGPDRILLDPCLHFVPGAN